MVGYLPQKIESEPVAINPSCLASAGDAVYSGSDEGTMDDAIAPVFSGLILALFEGFVNYSLINLRTR